jgi:general secretion pathway protein D
MKKITIYLSRFLIISLIVPNISFALDQRTSAQDGLSAVDATLIDAKTTPDSTTPETKKTERVSTQGALSAADAALSNTITASQNTELVPKKDEPLQEQATVECHYVNEDLINIVNALATKKGVNVIIPLGANALSTKVTLSLPNRITLDDAWALLQTLLDLSGYSMIPRGDMYYITKKSAATAKEALPLFVGMKPSDLPDTDERIRYIYYFSNIKVTDAPDSELATLLKELLQQPDSAFKMDPPSNGIIISARSREIKSLMEILIKLDKVGFLEKFEILKLRFALAKDVADLFNQSLLKTDADPNRYRLDTKGTSDATYFSKFMRIIPDERTNSLIILGRFQAIERVKEFIRHYIDVKIEAGKSPLHVYDLEYLNAKDLADILEKIIKAGADSGTGQSQAGAPVSGGTQRQFGDVKIMSDTPIEQATEANKDASAPRYYGGNKLIIACGSDDWYEIEKLIQDLDQPKAQVLIEVLIADMTLDDIRALGMSLRNPDAIPMPGSTNFQTTNLGNEPFITEGTSPNATLKSDLLLTEALPAPQPATLVGNERFKGAMVMSFNDTDGKVWGVADILNNISSLKVLSAPHIIATNNKKALIERTEERLLRDQSSPSGTATSVAYQYKPATLSVEITPRISENDDVNMQIVIKVNEFVTATDSTSSETPVRRTREITANATVGNNNILVLGGLAKIGDAQAINATPFLSKIPLIGWLFKSKTTNFQKANLSIFIKPIIIRPNVLGGIQEHTQEYLGYLENATGKGDALFGDLKDPITRLFFCNDSGSNELVDNFLRFKKESFDRAARTPTQNIDLTEPGASHKITKRKTVLQNQNSSDSGLESERDITRVLDLKKNNLPDENVQLNASVQEAEEAEPSRDEMAKRLLQNADNPLANQ